MAVISRSTQWETDAARNNSDSSSRLVSVPTTSSQSERLSQLLAMTSRTGAPATAADILYR